MQSMRPGKLLTTRRARRRVPILLLALAALLATVMPSPATAASFGAFEIDGNLADDPTAGDDWATLPPGHQVTYTDGTGQSDDVFGTGSKELAPGEWSCVTGSAPAKDDIANGAVAFRRVAGKQYLYVRFQRYGVNGDAHMDYEFNHSRTPNPACPSVPSRTNGDFMISFDTENGGATIIVRAFRWSGDARAGTFEEVPLASGTYSGAVNIPPSLTIPGVANGAFGEAALNLTDTLGDLSCGQHTTAYMKTRSSTSITSALKDRTGVKEVGFQPADAAAANASGSAYGARVQENLPLPLDTTLAPVKSEKHGPGAPSSQSAQVLAVNIPPSTGTTLKADVVRTSSTSSVTNNPARSSQTSVAEAMNVNILAGAVTASEVRGVARTIASPTGSSFSSTGSALKDLKVNGVSYNDVTPDTRVALPADLYGEGSYVALFERAGSTSSPAPGQIEGGTYAAELTVNMIRVRVTALAATGASVDVTVSNAVGRSDFPQQPGCAGSPNSVSGHAFVTEALTDPTVAPVTAGYVSIPPSGGRDRQDLTESSVPSATTGTAVSETSGTLDASSSAASSFARAEQVCVLPGATACTITARAVESHANSRAGASGATSDDTGTALVGVNVLGAPVTPGRNTTITLPEIGYVVLNEQDCDGAATLTTCAGSTHSGLTVVAIHVVITKDGALGLPAGAEIKVAEAHSGATYVT